MMAYSDKSDKRNELKLFVQIYQNDDLLFSEIFFGFSLALVDQINKTNVISESILNKSSYKNKIFDKFVKKICRIILETSVLVFILLLFQSLYKGFLPGKAEAMPAPTSRVGVSTTIVHPSRKADTLHIQDDSYRHSKHVVIPALQP